MDTTINISLNTAVIIILNLLMLRNYYGHEFITELDV